MNKFKTIKGSIALLMAVVIVVLFQNCSGSGFTSGEIIGSSTQDIGAPIDAPTGILEFTYPSVTSAFTLRPGHVLTIKILKPEGVSKESTYWRIAQDYYAMASYYGPVMEKGQYIYISLTVSPYFTGTRDLNLYLLDLQTDQSVVANDAGFKFTIDSVGTADHGVGDAVVEMCSVSSEYAPALSFDRTVTEVREALLIGDNGGGVGGASCVFIKDTEVKTVNCLNTSEWPGDWKSWTVQVSARSRCGATNNREFAP